MGSETVGHPRTGRLPQIWIVASVALLASACTPTVKVEAPQEPITINLNVKIEHEVRVKLEQTAETAIETNQELF